MVRPGVIRWYRIFCALMAFASLATVVIGIALAVYAPVLGPRLANVLATSLIGGGVTLGLPFVVALFLRETPRAWVYHLVLICLALLLCFPVAIVLLAFWIRPEAQRYFGRAVPTLDASLEPPGVLFWYRATCVVMLLLLALTSCVVWYGGLLVGIDEVAFALLAGIFWIGFLASFFLPRRPWAWTFHLVLIDVWPMVFCLPAGVFLHIFWTRPDVQRYFGRRVEASGAGTVSAV